MCKDSRDRSRINTFSSHISLTSVIVAYDQDKEGGGKVVVDHLKHQHLANLRPVFNNFSLTRGVKFNPRGEIGPKDEVCPSNEIGLQG
jgi:hypothetical protein